MMHSFRTLSLIAIASLAVAKFAPSQEAEISERNPVLEDPASNNVLRRCVTCSTETPTCPTCPDGSQCILTPPSCDACQSTVCVPYSSSFTASAILHPTPSSDISSIRPTASAPANATFTGGGTLAIYTQLTGFPVIVAAAGIAACLL